MYKKKLTVLDGNYDSDITMNPKVNLFSIYDNPLASANHHLISCVRSICKNPLRESPVLLLLSENLSTIKYITPSAGSHGGAV
jgi:hypothetical protein